MWLRRWRGVRQHFVVKGGRALCGAVPFRNKDWYHDHVMPACPTCEARFKKRQESL